MMCLSDSFPAHPADARSDQALLEAFCNTGDERAFAQIARRHGGMVLAVCRSVLGPSSDADDASQAVLLTLAQKASSTHVRRHLVGWLHRVAWYIAARAAQARAIRRRHEQEAAKMRPEMATDAAPAIPLEALHAGLAALPEKHRVPLLLYYFEGRTQEEIAALLGCGASALAMRLHRGRQLLRERLAANGIAATTTGVSAVLVTGSSEAPSPAFVALAAKSAAAVFAKPFAATALATHSTTLALSKGALNMLFWAKVKLVASVAAALLLTGGAVDVYVVTSKATAPTPALRSPQSAVEPLTFAPRSQSAAHLASIGAALASFAQAHNGALPNDLGELAYVTGLSTENFFKPASGNSMPDDLEPEAYYKWIFQMSDYEYIPGLSRAGADVVIAFEKYDANSEGGINVLFGDGRVEFITRDFANQAITRSEILAEAQGTRG